MRLARGDLVERREWGNPQAPSYNFTLQQRQASSASWLRRYLGEAGYDVSQTSSSPEHPFIIGPQDGLHITVTPLDSPPWIAAESSDQKCQEEVDELVQRSGEASSRVMVCEDDFGGVVWYACTLSDEQPNLADPMFFSRVQQLLHTPARLEGWHRLGNGVLLNFREDGSNLPDGAAERATVLFHPKALIDVYIAVPGPADGPLTRPIAHQFAEVVAAICTFTLGRPINLPPMVMPVQDSTPRRSPTWKSAVRTSISRWRGKASRSTRSFPWQSRAMTAGNGFAAHC